MNLWHDRRHVRLQSRELGGYLHADDDGFGVSVRGRRASLNTAWAVHVYHGDLHLNGQGIFLLLHSAAYGRYLAATAAPAPSGHIGFRVAQRNYEQPQVAAIMWQVIGAGAANAVLLRNVRGRYLRANGKFRPWNKGVTVDQFGNSTMMHWIVEPIPLRDGMPAISDAPVIYRIFESPAWQLIRFVLADDDGLYPEEVEQGWSALYFRGRSAYGLRNVLARHLGLMDYFINLVMCVRAGRYGRLTPLVDNLPRDGRGVTIEIVIFMSGTPAANALRHPNVDIHEDVEE